MKRVHKVLSKRRSHSAKTLKSAGGNVYKYVVGQKYIVEVVADSQPDPNIQIDGTLIGLNKLGKQLYDKGDFYPKPKKGIKLNFWPNEMNRDNIIYGVTYQPAEGDYFF